MSFCSNTRVMLLKPAWLPAETLCLVGELSVLVQSSLIPWLLDVAGTESQWHPSISDPKNLKSGTSGKSHRKLVLILPSRGHNSGTFWGTRIMKKMANGEPLGPPGRPGKGSYLERLQNEKAQGALFLWFGHDKSRALDCKIKIGELAECWRYWKAKLFCTCALLFLTLLYFCVFHFFIFCRMHLSSSCRGPILNPTTCTASQI